MFNLEEYTTVAERIKMFRQMFPMGRIITHLINDNPIYIVFKAELYRDDEDARPFSTGWAKEVIAERGVNRDFALENCETSSIGIACKNADIGTEKHSISREEAAKVKAKNEKAAPKPFAEKLADKITVEKEDDPWITKEVHPAPSAADAIALVQDVLGAVKIEKEIPLCRNCHDHKPMTWKTGVSAKTKKPWANFNCYACKDVIWYEIKADGSWGAQENKW
jgi:hypothetical protein